MGINISKRIITGLDIRCNSILAITVAKKYDIYQIRMIQDISLKDNIEVKNIDSYHQLIVSKLKEIKQKTSGSPYIALSLAESEVLAKEITLSTAEVEAGVQSALYQKFAKVVPLPIEELAIDYSCHQNHYQVFATRKDGVFVRQKIAQDSGFKLGLIDTEKQAYLQSLGYVQQRFNYTNSVLVDVGSSYVRFGAFAQNAAFYRSVEIPSELLTTEALLRDFVFAEWQKIQAQHPELEPDVILIYISPVYSLSLFQLLEVMFAQECRCVDLSTLLDGRADLSVSVDAPFIALGSALRAFKAIESQKYAA